jgi:RNA polymerase sigma-70 factor, ECF subfamily
MQTFTETINTRPDHELVQLAQQGRQDAFTELMRRSSAMSFKMALGILRDPHDAEDEVQNAYWKAWQHLGRFNQDAKFSTWMTRIVINQCLMRLRETRRASFLYLDSPPGDESRAMDLPEPGASPEDALGSKEVAAMVRREINRLPKLLRETVVMRDLEGLSMEEMARRLGISVPAAKSRLLRARMELRGRILKQCGRADGSARYG